jgi:hypothetical protein
VPHLRVTTREHVALGPDMAMSSTLRVLLGLVSVAFLASCGAAMTGGGSSPSPGSTPQARLMVATDPDNGKTFELHVGDRLEVKLESTYWNIHESSDLNVLRLAGPMAISPRPNGCVPGAGCGLAIASFDAVGSGSADVTASRDSCGEAMRCVGSAGSYRVSVVVISLHFTRATRRLMSAQSLFDKSARQSPYSSRPDTGIGHGAGGGVVRPTSRRHRPPSPPAGRSHTRHHSRKPPVASRRPR